MSAAPGSRCSPTPGGDGKERSSQEGLLEPGGSALSGISWQDGWGRCQCHGARPGSRLQLFGAKMDPGWQEQSDLSHHPTIPSQEPPPWPPIPVSPGFSSKLGHPSLLLSHQFTSSPGPPVASPGCRGRGALALGEIRSAGETSGSGFGGLSPVPALALTASSFVLLTA